MKLETDFQRRRENEENLVSYSDWLVLYGASENNLSGNWEEGLVCEIYVDRICLEHFSEFKYFEYVLDEAEGSREPVSGKSVTGVIRSLVDARSLQLECVRVMHESLLMPVLTYSSETMIWKQKERSRIRALQIDNLRGLLGIRRRDKILNAWISELCGMMKKVENRIEDVLWWLQKRWIDTMKV